jgi:hypothetical protein
MAVNFTSTSLSGSYDDDYDKLDNYHQILFNNGRALQARELTQLQTMIYEQISRFGHNVFKEGASITSQGIRVNVIEFVTIGAINSGGTFDNVPVGTVFTSSSNGIQARVLDVQPSGSGFAHDTLYIQYINNQSSTQGSTELVFGNLDTLTGGGYELVTRSTSATGKGTLITVDEGMFFTMGQFVRSNAQKLYIAPYNGSFDGTVGFKVVQDIVTVNDTSDLYDNAQGVVNTTSPGADRYRIQLTLIDKANITSSDTFVYVARLQNSTIIDAVRALDSYNKIRDMIAERTHEESGNYVVNPFTLDVDSDVTDPNSLLLTVGSGVAYVNGYRVETPAPVKLRVPKPQATELENNDTIGISYGNYVIAAYAEESRGLPKLDQRYTFRTASNDFASARVKSVDYLGQVPDAGGDVNSAVRIYLYDYLDSAGTLRANPAPADGLRSSELLYSSGTDQFTLDGNSVQRASGQTKLLEANNSMSLFPVSYARPERIDDVVLTIQGESLALNTGAGTSIALPQLPAGESYVDTSLWLAGNSTTTIEDPAGLTINLTNNDRDATIDGLSTGTSYDVLFYKQKTGTAISKTLTTTDSVHSFNPFVPTRGDRPETYRGKYIDLSVPDIYEIDSVRDTNSAGEDIRNYFVFDNGQRDNFYGNGRLYFDSSVGNTFSNPVYVKFKHFTRGSGDFYSAASYNVPYRDIPEHQLSDGTVVNLREFIDFRPDINTRTDTVTKPIPLPRNGDNLTADVDYYVPRADKVLITQEGSVQVLMGQQARNPQFKKTPDNSLELFKVVLNANTVSEDDLQITPIEHKRYTMADIAKLEAKLDRHVETTTLNFLELSTKLNSLFDSDGVERVESAIVTDDVSDQTQADIDDPAYSASIDPDSRLYRPGFDEENIRLIKDSADCTNVKFMGDNAYIRYTTTSWKSQQVASGSTYVKSSGTQDRTGTLVLSPSSDEWKDVVTDASRALHGRSRIAVKQALLWNNWAWNWVGRSNEDLYFNEDQPFSSQDSRRRRRRLTANPNSLSNTSTVPTEQSTNRSVNRIVPSNTLRNHIRVGATDRIIDLALIPWIRSRKIHFKATGLKANTRFTPFFNGVNVSNWCREETFVRFADRTDDIGNNYITATSHPDGVSDLISDANGEIEGSFVIPNVRGKWAISRRGRSDRRKLLEGFRAGMREFRLLDINENNWDAAGSRACSTYAVGGAINTVRGSIVSTRSENSNETPYGVTSSTFGTIYGSAEIKKQIDAVSAGDVNLIEPHLSGKWGLEDVAVNPSSYVGQMSSIISDYVDVNQNNNAGNTVLNPGQPMMPFAQSFYVDNQWGVLLTKVSLYFSERDATDIPVTISIRPVVDGKPSLGVHVPGSEITVARDNVNIAGDQTQLSNILAANTDFIFEEPVFLKPWTEYAIVVKTLSTEYKLFTAKSGEFAIGSTTKRVSTEDAKGALFLPQSSVTYDASLDLDLMFSLERAKFSTSGSDVAGANASLVLQHAEIPAKLLDDNPIRTENGSSTIYVTHPCHGLHVGDYAIITSAVDTGGITAANINGQRLVTGIDAQGYQVAAGASATSAVKGGGDGVISARNIMFDVVNPYLESIVPNQCSVDVSAKFTTGKSISGSETKYQRDLTYSRITPNQNTDFGSPRMIADDTNAQNFLQENGSNIASKVSAYIKVDLKSGNDYVSPVIDLQRASLILIGNCIHDPVTTPAIYPVSETQPSSGTDGAKHISAPVMLEQEGVGFECRFDARVPSQAGVQFYYRTTAADGNIQDEKWILQEPENTVPKDNDLTVREYNFLPGGQNGGLQAFQQVQTKVVMTSTSSAAVPFVKNLTWRVLAT